MVVVPRHLIHQVDFPGEVGAHRPLDIAVRRLARLQPYIVGRAGEPIGAALQGQARRFPGRRAAAQGAGVAAKVARGETGEEVLAAILARTTAPA